MKLMYHFSRTIEIKKKNKIDRTSKWKKYKYRYFQKSFEFIFFFKSSNYISASISMYENILYIIIYIMYNVYEFLYIFVYFTNGLKCLHTQRVFKIYLMILIINTMSQLTRVHKSNTSISMTDWQVSIIFFIDIFVFTRLVYATLLLTVFMILFTQI